jgi:hypothetical protein
MNSHRPLLNQHRVRRLALWTLAVLSWIATMLFSDRAIALRHAQRFDLISLPWLTKVVAQLLIIRAGQLARLRPHKRILYWRRGRDLRRAHLFRSTLGSRLRRALRHKDVRVWIANLIAILRTLDTYAAPLAKRLRRRLTRLLRLFPPIAPAQIPLGPSAPPPAFSDSS